MGPEYLRASNGDGPAVRATISSQRLPGDMDVITDSVANWPAKGIATSGTPDEDGIIIPDTECVFYYVLSGTIIHITGFAPGYHDVGNSEDQIVIIKPNTAWADELAEATEGVTQAVGGMQTEIDTIPAQVDASLLPIHTDEANSRVGINKAPTQGALDVDGDIYSNGVKVLASESMDASSWFSLPSSSSNSVQATAVKIGRMLYITGVVTLGGALTGNYNVIDVPYVAAHTDLALKIGNISFVDVSAGTYSGPRLGDIRVSGSGSANTILRFTRWQETGVSDISQTNPFTWAAGDRIVVNLALMLSD